MEIKEEERKRKRKGKEEKRRSVQQLAGQPATTWQRRCLEWAEWGQVIPSAARHRWDEHYQMLK